MRPPTPTLQIVKTLEYEVVERGFRSIKIIVFAEGISESTLEVFTRNKRIHIYAERDGAEVFCVINIGFSPKKLTYKYNNGVLTIEARRRLLFI